MKPENLKKITELRHRLHRIPELSMKEVKTKQCLMDFLKKETILEVTDAGRWFYAVCRGREGLQRNGLHRATSDEGHQNRLTQAIAFRADLDALPIEDRSDLPYTSEHPGISHCCGHDGHSAALAGLALELVPGKYPMDIYLIFQHGEEIGGGGEECAALISEKKISKVFAFHNWSGFPEGSILVRDGVSQCASKGATAVFTGRTAHASQPEDGRNPACAVAELVLEIKEAEKDTEARGLLMTTVVAVSVGSRNFGIAASEGSVSVTLRAGFEADMKRLENRLREKAVFLAERDGLTVQWQECDIFPETVNDSVCVGAVRQAAQKNGFLLEELQEPFRASEDFGYYLKACPGAMFYIGNGVDYPQIHTVGYDFNDRILETAVEMFIRIVECATDALGA